MSISTIQFAPPFTPCRSCSTAWWALRFGRNPYELSRKSASKIGSSTTFAAARTTRSRTVGMPSGRRLPSAFRISTRRPGRGRYRPSRSSVASSPRNPATPLRSMSPMLCPSTPAAPAFARTSCHARAKMASRYTLSYSAWNRRSGLAFAARYSARWSRRAASMVSLAPSAFTSAYLLRAPRPSAAPSLRRGCVVHGLAGTLGRSDSRSALPRFVGAPLIGLGAPGPPSRWHPDGLTAGAETGLSCSHLGSPTVPCPLRRGVLRGCISKRFTPSLAFASALQARLPGAPLTRDPSFDAADFAACYGPLGCTSPPEARPRASAHRALRTPAGCYKAGLVPPLAGLAPASRCKLQDAQRSEGSGGLQQFTRAFTAFRACPERSEGMTGLSG